MKFKAIAIGAMMLIVVAALAGCAPAAPAPTAAPTEVATAAPTADATTEATAEATAEATDAAETGAGVLLELTLEELAAYDGKDGRPAYVAIDGTIYDVTDIPAWNNGTHNGNTAGKDQTEAIKRSPHGQSVLAKLPVVGKLK